MSGGRNSARSWAIKVPRMRTLHPYRRRLLPGRNYAKLVSWNATKVLSALRAHEQELRAVGVVSASLFGSVARGEDATHDVAVRLSETFSAPGLHYFSRLSELEGRLSGILGRKADVVEEPTGKKRFQAEIDRDRALAF